MEEQHVLDVRQVINLPEVLQLVLLVLQDLIPERSLVAVRLA